MSFVRTSVASSDLVAFRVALADPEACALTDHVEHLRVCFRMAMVHWPFEIDHAVVLPAEIQTIWALPRGDALSSERWRLIKSMFSRHMPHLSTQVRSDRGVRPHDKGIWSRGFGSKDLRSLADYRTHVEHMAMAPVRAGLVVRPEDWPHGSFSRTRSGRNRAAKADLTATDLSPAA